jgi:hypothetical protein
MTRKTSIQAANRGCGKSIGQTDALGLVQFWERFCSRSVDGLVVFFFTGSVWARELVIGGASSHARMWG